MMKHRFGSWLVAGCLAAGALAPISEADAALNFYVKLKGQKTGEIKGSVAQKGREGAIAVIAVSHSIVSPRDAASGLPTGKRTHKPFVITKQIDRSTPLLHGVLVNNEILSEAVFTVYEANPKGESLAYTIKMSNASVASIELRTDAEGKLVEDVSFVYQKIEWTTPDGASFSSASNGSENAVK